MTEENEITIGDKTYTYDELASMAQAKIHDMQREREEKRLRSKESVPLHIEDKSAYHLGLIRGLEERIKGIELRIDQLFAHVCEHPARTYSLGYLEVNMDVLQRDFIKVKAQVESFIDDIALIYEIIGRMGVDLVNHYVNDDAHGLGVTVGPNPYYPYSKGGQECLRIDILTHNTDEDAPDEREEEIQ